MCASPIAPLCSISGRSAGSIDRRNRPGFNWDKTLRYAYRIAFLGARASLRRDAERESSARPHLLAVFTCSSCWWPSGPPVATEWSRAAATCRNSRAPQKSAGLLQRCHSRKRRVPRCTGVHEFETPHSAIRPGARMSRGRNDFAARCSPPLPRRPTPADAKKRKDQYDPSGHVPPLPAPDAQRTDDHAQGCRANAMPRRRRQHAMEGNSSTIIVSCEKRIGVSAVEECARRRATMDTRRVRVLIETRANADKRSEHVRVVRLASSRPPIQAVSEVLQELAEGEITCCRTQLPVADIPDPAADRGASAKIWWLFVDFSHSRKADRYSLRL